jgi:hypothetical protein
VIVKRVFVLMSGMGLSINGKHIYCGDYIFSGHTMVLTLGFLVIKECKRRLFYDTSVWIRIRSVRSGSGSNFQDPTFLT